MSKIGYFKVLGVYVLRIYVIGGMCPGVYVLGLSVRGVHVWKGFCPISNLVIRKNSFSSLISTFNE